jgi:hypothetical protein
MYKLKDEKWCCGLMLCISSCLKWVAQQPYIASRRMTYVASHAQSLMGSSNAIFCVSVTYCIYIVILYISRGPLSLVSTSEELLDRNVAAPV